MPDAVPQTDKPKPFVGENRGRNTTGDMKCARCGTTKPTTEFGRKQDGRFKSTCKRCLNQINAKARKLAKPRPDQSHLAIRPQHLDKHLANQQDDDNFANLDNHTIQSAHYYSTRQSSLKAANETRWDWEKKDFKRFISSKKLIIRLQYHALGKVEMQNSAVRAAIALLDRVVPVLQSVEAKIDHVHRYVLEVPATALTSHEWEAETVVPDTTLAPALPKPSKAKAKSKA